ncbi:hypothetical protein Tco_1171979 [Tanacetum coccineum]
MEDNTQAKAMGEVKNVRIQIGYQAYVVDLLILDIPVDPECTLSINDGVIRHTYFPKPRSKLYVEAFEIEGEDDWLGSFEVGRDENGNVKYGLGNEGYRTYKKVDGDGDWHARFEVVTPSERKFNRTFKTKTTTRKLSGKFKTEDILRFSHFLD